MTLVHPFAVAFTLPIWLILHLLFFNHSSLWQDFFVNISETNMLSFLRTSAITSAEIMCLYLILSRMEVFWQQEYIHYCFSSVFYKMHVHLLCPSKVWINKCFSKMYRISLLWGFSSHLELKSNLRYGNCFLWFYVVCISILSVHKAEDIY